MRNFMFVSVLLASVSANAAQITLDFEDLADDISGIQPLEPVQQVGSDFTITPDSGTVVWLNGGPTPESLGIVMAPGGQMTLSQGGSSFDLLSFDYSFANTAVVTKTLSLTATKSDGQQVQLSFSDVFSSSFSTWSAPGSTFTDIVSFTFNTTAGVKVDNIVVSAVPVPAAVWLFGSALATLGRLRRQKAN
jgi:hypothetical protein